MHLKSMTSWHPYKSFASSSLSMWALAVLCRSSEQYIKFHSACIYLQQGVRILACVCYLDGFLAQKALADASINAIAGTSQPCDCGPGTWPSLSGLQQHAAAVWAASVLAHQDH